VVTSLFTGQPPALAWSGQQELLDGLTYRAATICCSASSPCWENPAPAVTRPAGGAAAAPQEREHEYQDTQAPAPRPFFAGTWLYANSLRDHSFGL